MFGRAAWFVLASAVTLLVGPFAFFTSQIGRPDPGDLYVIVDIGGKDGTTRAAIASGAAIVGPTRAPLATMIHAPQPVWARLSQAGYLLLPAGAVAAICGIDTAQYAPEGQRG